MTSEREQARERGIHEVFEISIVLKGIGALVETLLGVFLPYSTGTLDLIRALLQNELIDDPEDFFASHLFSLINPSPEALQFGSLYLLSHGIVKLILIVGLMRRKIWAYPASIAIFTLFIAYQSVRYLRTHSLWLLFLNIVDLFVIWLIWHEYRRLRHKHPQT